MSSLPFYTAAFALINSLNICCSSKRTPTSHPEVWAQCLWLRGLVMTHCCSWTKARFSLTRWRTHPPPTSRITIKMRHEWRFYSLKCNLNLLNRLLARRHACIINLTLFFQKSRIYKISGKESKLGFASIQHHFLSLRSAVRPWWLSPKVQINNGLIWKQRNYYGGTFNPSLTCQQAAWATAFNRGFEVAIFSDSWLITQ